MNQDRNPPPADDSTLPPSDPSAPSSPPGQTTRIGRYRVVDVLGEGSYGRVYLAHDDDLDRPVAIKVPLAKRVSRPADAEAYLAEARILAALSHPNIIAVHDVGRTEDGSCFVVSKFIEGSDLARLLQTTPPNATDATRLVATVAEALHHAHRHGLVHRDVKPANILIDKAGAPILADFGLALKDVDFGKGSALAGTPAYMSPEQAKGEGHRVDGRSDIFSLGVVFYEMLTKKRPFQSDSQDELLERIAEGDVKPPRQLDEKIPKELERICLKAMSRRASDRYTAAMDMADDLLHFLGERSSKQPLASTGWQSASSPPIVSSPATGSLPIKIVPKGLRSFDVHDAGFFLELLPGPRDRDGLPDTIRFWKTRIEDRDSDSAFTVGLLYGPSGCGKSSLAKAGLLPHLAEDILVVYLEATATETETRLQSGLRKRCPSFAADLSLKATLEALRRGEGIPAGKKVLIVLDQFEQWLHAKKDQANTELVSALRQCDGVHLQAIVMVRDDFWMAATRFMRELEVRLVEGQNSAAVDLFPVRHAKKVLAAFGRAFGCLPENIGETTTAQKQFVDHAVAGLAQEGKVISVRLSLFAEMMKGKSWTPAALKAVGGTEGVGVAFLEETFSAPSAPPEHRYRQNAARAVLKALLPESGTDIKGHTRSRKELLEASGYASRPRDFDDLLGILDGEIRLLTPTDPEGKSSEESTTRVQSRARCYQLTHDYLVPLLRDWLTRKQKETRRGRAELLLADRAAVWSVRPENRQLPSLRQWLGIRWLTAQKTWTPAQRKMMRTATRFHVGRGTLVAILLAATAFTGFALLHRADQRQKETQAAGLVQALLHADISQVPTLIRDMADLRTWTDPLLRKEKDAAPVGSRRMLHASLALLPDAAQVGYLFDRLLDAEPREVAVIRDALLPHMADSKRKLWAVALAPKKGLESQRLRAAAALAKYDPASDQWNAIAPSVIDDLVRENPVYLGLWTDAFKDVRSTLRPPLAVFIRDPQPERAAERTLALNLLADYGADRPEAFVDLAMDADAAQFAVFFPKAGALGEKAIAKWRAEIARRPAAIADKTVFESKGTITDDDAKVKRGKFAPLSSKRFEVRLKGGTKYRIAMTSTEVDSFLVVHDRAGKEVAVDDDGGGDWNALLVYAPPQDDTYVVFAAALHGEALEKSKRKETGAFSLTIAEIADADSVKENLAERENLAKRQANAAAALLRMSQPEGVWPLLKHSSDPRGRSYLIHRMGPMGVDAGMIVKRLEEEPDLSIRRALILSLGEYGETAISPEDRKTVTARLQAIYRSNTDGASGADPGLHAAAEWLLRSWKQESWLKKRNEEWKTAEPSDAARIEPVLRRLRKGTKDPQWYVNGEGQTMVVIPGPVEVRMGSPTTEIGRRAETQHTRRIGRTFAVAAKAVTVEEYRRFQSKHSFSEEYAPEADCPVVNTSWFEAAAYCNRLSEAEGIEPSEWCYEETKEGQATKLRKHYLSLSGYRLPTEAEIEYVTRAGSATSRFFGETEELLPKYAWYMNDSKERTWPVGRLKPNDLGFFDVHGNVLNWCQESYGRYSAADKEDREDDLTIVGARERVLRGGSFSYQASYVRSAFRVRFLPKNRLDAAGFRPARTLPAGSLTALPPTP